MLLASAEAEESQAEEVLRWNPITLDPLRYEVRVGGRFVDLTVTEFNLMACFLRNPRRILSRQQLLQEVWSASPEATTRTVDTHVYRLRKKLGSLSDCIRTVRGLGYALDSE